MTKTFDAVEMSCRLREQTGRAAQRRRAGMH